MKFAMKFALKFGMNFPMRGKECALASRH